jgi:hypothetical protein
VQEERGQWEKVEKGEEGCERDGHFGLVIGVWGS